MSMSKKDNIINIILGVISVTLAINSYSYAANNETPVDSSHRAPASSVEDIMGSIKLENPTILPLSNYDPFVTKDLFRSARTEWTPPPPPPPSPPPPPPPEPKKPSHNISLTGLKLKGTIIIDGFKNIGLLDGNYQKITEIEEVTQDISGAKTSIKKDIVEVQSIKDRRVYEGDIIANNKITSISKDSISLLDEQNLNIILPLHPIEKTEHSKTDDIDKDSSNKYVMKKILDGTSYNSRLASNKLVTPNKINDNEHIIDIRILSRGSGTSSPTPKQQKQHKEVSKVLNPSSSHGSSNSTGSKIQSVLQPASSSTTGSSKKGKSESHFSSAVSKRPSKTTEQNNRIDRANPANTTPTINSLPKIEQHISGNKIPGGDATGHISGN